MNVNFSTQSRVNTLQSFCNVEFLYVYCIISKFQVFCFALFLQYSTVEFMCCRISVLQSFCTFEFQYCRVSMYIEQFIIAEFLPFSASILQIFYNCRVSILLSFCIHNTEFYNCSFIIAEVLYCRVSIWLSFYKVELLY